MSETWPASRRFDGRYAGAVNEALERLAGYGPEWGPGLAFHAPMAAEALAALGYPDQVAAWVEAHRESRSFSRVPDPRQPIDRADRADQRAALGDFARATDWTLLFDAELAERPWPAVLARWWPVLLPGLLGRLGHGLIRTAHAVRALAAVAEPTPAQLHELAQGMGYWAARWLQPDPPDPRSPLVAAAAPHAAPGQEVAALAAVSTAAASLFAERAPVPAVPLVHTVTIPAAVELVLPVLPAQLHEVSLRWGLAGAAAVLRQFGSYLQPAAVVPAGAEVPSVEQCAARAVENGDEHAIKLAEVAARRGSGPEGVPYRRAVATVLQRLQHGQAVPGFARQTSRW